MDNTDLLGHLARDIQQITRELTRAIQDETPRDARVQHLARAGGLAERCRRLTAGYMPPEPLSSGVDDAVRLREAERASGILRR